MFISLRLLSVRVFICIFFGSFAFKNELQPLRIEQLYNCDFTAYLTEEIKAFREKNKCRNPANVNPCVCVWDSYCGPNCTVPVLVSRAEHVKVCSVACLNHTGRLVFRVAASRFLTGNLWVWWGHCRPHPASFPAQRSLRATLRPCRGCHRSRSELSRLLRQWKGVKWKRIK